jgi:mono/diheme cytochrome c family protein/uncharacterized membrane protein
MPIFEYLGRFHPLLVHLPIGIILIGLLLTWKAFRDQSDELFASIRLTFLAGALSATISSITGYLISLFNDYDPSMVNMHQWMGIGLTVLCWAAYIVLYHKKLRLSMPYLALLVGMGILLLFTGHLGGSLTHGKSFLHPPPISTWFENTPPTIAKLDSNSRVYDAVSIVLEQKCISCHGQKRQRGGLRLDQPDLIQSGGENGVILTAGRPLESSLLLRLLLPEEEEEHMPPAGRKQLNEDEINLIHWWIAEGASFETKISQASLPDSIRLPAPEGPSERTKPAFTDLPAETVTAADPRDIEAVRALGGIVLPVAEGSNHLSVNFINLPDEKAREALTLLIALADQLVWLKMSDKPFTSDDLAPLSQLTSLFRLSLDNCDIDDRALEHMRNLSRLRYLNLSGTSVSAKGLTGLKSLTNLQSVYASNTTIQEADLPELQSVFPETSLVVGSFTMPVSDTVNLSAD